MQIRSKKFFVKTSLSVSRNSFSRVSCGGRGCWRRRKRTRRSASRDAFTECARGHCRTKKQILFCFCLHYALFSIANVPDDSFIWPLARTVNAIEVRFLPPLPRLIKESCANNYRDVRGDRLRRKPITASAYSYACDFIDTSIWKRRNWWTSPENAKTIAQTPVLATKNEKNETSIWSFLAPFYAAVTETNAYLVVSYCLTSSEAKRCVSLPLSDTFKKAFFGIICLFE